MSVKRTITSVVYVIVVAALCAAKWLIPSGGGNYLFDALFCAISVLGAIEVTRALGFISYLQRYVAILFCGFSIPVYLAFELTMSAGVSGIAYVLGAGALFICVLFVADHASSNLKSTLGALFTLLYAGLLPLILSVINHMETNLSMLAIMVLFISVPFTDAGAFLIGIALGKKLPLKLAPHISPNKTVVGGAGGIIGGVGGAVIAYYVFTAFGEAAFDCTIPYVVAIILIGLAVSVVTQFGDLFESAVKRECGIKDMGKLLPGHGGVMDRFDGTLFAGIVIFVAFMLLA